MRRLVNLLAKTELLSRFEFYPAVDADADTLKYLAGLFDGEGCVRIENHQLKDPKRKNHMRDHLVCIISNTYLPVLEECKKLFGGCIKRGSKVHKQCWAWKLSSRSAYIFLNAIYPYSKIKKRQIEIALEYVRLFKNKNSWGNRGMPESQKAQRRMYAKRLSEMKLEDDFSRR